MIYRQAHPKDASSNILAQPELVPSAEGVRSDARVLNHATTATVKESDAKTPTSAAKSVVATPGQPSTALPEVRSGNVTPSISRRVSLDPPQTFAEGQHIGPSAGVSFLYHAWNRSGAPDDEATLPTARLTCHGDMPQPPVTKNPHLPTREEASTLLERYFQFATPTYRFLHRPTVEKWMSELIDGAQLLKAEAACALIVCSQALLYTEVGDRYWNGGDEGLNRSRAYFDKAKFLLDQEPGPATVVSVQARLAMCLYLLSTFRINECRFCFSLACTILTSIGLQRKTLNAHKLDLVALESRKRTFWCAYVLDDYLSVMLGRPRILHDGDIDQEYPRNVDDNDLLSSESPEDLPLHGNLEAFIAHADLAKLMGRNSHLLYPLQPLTEDEVLERTHEMLYALDNWRASLPDFLKPRDKTLAGQRTFERQNTVLKLAYAHLRILATRRCLLADFGRLGRRAPSVSAIDDRALKPIQECVAAVCTILDAVYELSERGTMYQGFWFQPYVTLVAISTLYVFVIQKSRSTLPAGLFVQLDEYLAKARYCQELLAALSPEGSQARRHHDLLSRLRERAEKDALRTRRQENAKSAGAHGAAPRGGSAVEQIEDRTAFVEVDGQSAENTGRGQHQAQDDQVATDGGAVYPDNNNLDVMMGQFTPSEDDFMFQDLNGWGWESLDTVGFLADSDLFGLQP
ncbi:hypothetical protein LTR67_009165 [Exophiala xenobiotica]